ncbi:MAG: PadR family transcriptional regulator [Microscillaceae bacterium]
MNVENTQVQMRKGILEFCILHIISRGEVYSSDIIKELKEARIIVVEGTLYPLLARLRKSGLLDYTWKESPSGPPQKHYQLTPQGKDFLEKLNETWLELVESTTLIIRKSQSQALEQLTQIQLEALKIKRNL